MGKISTLPNKKKWRKLVCPSAPSETDIVVNILCTPNTLDQAAWAAFSWKLFAGEYFSIRIIVDGIFNCKFVRDFAYVFPDIPVLTARSLIAPELLGNNTLSEFSQVHSLGNKLLLILSLQMSSNTIYADSDVMIFNKPTEILDSIISKRSAYNQEASIPSYANSIVSASRALSLSPCERLNSGLIYCEKNSLSIPLAIALLEKSNYASSFSWFTEQTILSVLLNHTNSQPLSQKNYVVDSVRQFWWQRDIDYSSIHSRHFTGPVRHLFYKFGCPHLLSRV